MRSIIAAVLLALGAADVRAQSLDAHAAALQAQVEALNSGDTEALGAPVAWRQRIYEFYTRRAFQPAWTDARTKAELRRALEDSRLDGLDPADYHLPLLEQLESQATGDVSAELVAQYDILQTDALLRLAYHLSFGKVDPTTFDAQWNYVRTLDNVDVEREIDAALTQGNVYERLDALRPTHRLYTTLKRELARYRAAEATGRSMTVPTGPPIKPGGRDPRVPALRARLIASGDLVEEGAASSADEYDAALQEGVRRFQSRMGLTADAVVGARTIEDLNVPLKDRIRQLRVNLDRGRLLLNDLPREFVVVNIAGYQIYMVRGSDIVWQARAQVGKTYRRTPIFRSDITYLAWNPTWTVPPGIIRNDILPDAKRDPQSITRRGLDVLDGRGRKLDPATIDWSRYSTGIPYTLRQPPGPKNALGRVKFMFPNQYAVYLHDTPSRALFDADDRDFSSGCVRVERPIELALLLLKDPDKWNEASVARTIEAGRTVNATLPEKVPVLLAYWTAWVDAMDRVNFRRDVYGQDKLWAAGLEQDFSIRKQPLFREGALTRGE